MDATIETKEKPKWRHWKAYSNMAGGFIYFLYAGSLYCVSEITPYVTSYYGVPISAAQYVFPM